MTFQEAKEVANTIGFPVVVRPSYVLGGRAMEIVYTENDLAAFMEKATEAFSERPILIDKFLEDALEIDVDAVADGERCVVAGSWSISKRRASIRETAHAHCRLTPLTMTSWNG